jgi:hypothetical protein
MPKGIYKHESRPIAERFWLRVEKTDGCWFWTGGKNRRGYGRISRSRAEGPILASRQALVLAGCPDPGPFCALHHCDTPACVNPAHLFVGTKGDNIRDMYAKGRGATYRKQAP